MCSVGEEADWGKYWKHFSRPDSWVWVSIIIVGVGVHSWATMRQMWPWKPCFGPCDGVSLVFRRTVKWKEDADLGGDVMPLDPRGGAQDDGRGVDVIVDALGDIQPHAVGGKRVDVAVAVAREDLFAGEASVSLRGFARPETDRETAPLLPFQVDEAGVEGWGGCQEDESKMARG